MLIFRSMVRTVPDISTVGDGRIIRGTLRQGRDFTTQIPMKTWTCTGVPHCQHPAVIVLKMAWKWQEWLDSAERRNVTLSRTSELERADCELVHRLGIIWIAEWCTR